MAWSVWWSLEVSFPAAVFSLIGYMNFSEKSERPPPIIFFSVDPVCLWKKSEAVEIADPLSQIGNWLTMLSPS